MEIGGMARRLLLALGCVLFLAAPAAGGDIYHRKRAIDERLSSLHSKIAGAHERESALTQQIRVANVKIDAVAGDVAHAQTQLAVLQAQLEASRRNLERLNGVVARQTARLRSLKRQYRIALARLNERLVDAYETPDPDAVDVLLSATTMSELIDRVEYLAQIGTQDSRITKQLDTARDELHTLRERTRANRKRVAEETDAVRARTEEQQTVTQQLIASQQQLAAARESQQSALSSTKTTEQELVHESQLLANQSAALAGRIRAAQAAAAAAAAARAAAPPPTTSSGSPPPAASSPSPSPAPAPSSSGLIWPVQGPIASPFGPRCLSNGDCSFHPGIDIAAASGTPIRAAATGTVIYAGWMDGYGNLTVIDHGRGLATAYGHQSSLGVGLGASVSQGSVIGYVGCTGYCFGAHLHFEVRVNGEVVDPMGYL
ncbi:MAG: murein hydrolase activator EnvC family protein [Gaiellaceae bacterium]